MRLLVMAAVGWWAAGMAAWAAPGGAGARGEHPARHEMPEAARLGNMARMGSGTAWQPDATPMQALHGQSGRWELMFHGNAFLLYDQQTGPRGATRVVAPNWAMAMERRPLGGGELVLTQMLSFDPATVRPRGYPELFQVGETFRGEPLVDAQHPHDLFMALSAQYTRPVGRRWQGFVYAAPVGEPALGPVAFPHRLSAGENPFAPLGHHWQDSSHITFGVLTAGAQTDRLRLEGSWFKGREPDENRWDLDPIRLNSTAVRAQYLPGRNWHVQVSRGWLAEPEALEPGDVTRTTASATYTRPWPGGYLSTTLVWGRNREAGGHESDVVGLEGIWSWRQANSLWWRVENADRDGLLRDGPLSGQVHNINAATLGYTRELNRRGDWSVGLGGSLTFFTKPDALDPVYGRFPLGVLLFLRVRPAGRAHMPTHPAH